MKTPTKKVTPKLRSQINDKLDAKGFGGRERWRTPGNALAEAFEVLSQFGIESDEIVHSFALRNPSGTMNLQIAWTNNDDPFSPQPIRDAALFFTWTVLREGYVESVAYIS